MKAEVPFGPVSEFINSGLKLEFSYEGEGFNGDFDRTDPVDRQLLRATVYFSNAGEWEPAESGSLCTWLPIWTASETLELLAKAFLARLSEDKAQSTEALLAEQFGQPPARENLFERPDKPIEGFST